MIATGTMWSTSLIAPATASIADEEVDDVTMTGDDVAMTGDDVAMTEDDVTDLGTQTKVQ